MNRLKQCREIAIRLGGVSRIPISAVSHSLTRVGREITVRACTPAEIQFATMGLNLGGCEHWLSVAEIRFWSCDSLFRGSANPILFMQPHSTFSNRIIYAAAAYPIYNPITAPLQL